jgi:hypothetical protein
MYHLLPFHIERGETHSFSGLFRFCLPLGLFAYLVFHLLLKLPLLSLLPREMAARLVPFCRPGALLPKVSRMGVAISLFVGAITHLAWDALTHGATFGFRSLDVLQATLFSPGGYPVHLCDVLQGASSIIGVWLLVRWSLDWLRSAQPEALEIPLVDAGRRRWGVVLLILFATLAVIFSGTPHHPGVDAFEILSRVVSKVMTTMTIPILCYGFAWHVMRLRNRKGTS